MAIPLTKEQLLAVNDAERRTVDVPEWGGAVTLQRMGALAYQQVRAVGKRTDFDDPEQAVRFALAYVAACVVDPQTGEPVFDGEALAVLERRSPQAVDRLFAAALELHGATTDAAEELEKNSEPTANDDGGFDSRGSADTPIPSTCSPS
ncbi:MAG: hypothetical protein WCR65_03815 [Parcubacteria group bacterium]|jgi:hypothetical protein|nr:hypothetical protein [Planctomycetota bacterium]